MKQVEFHEKITTDRHKNAPNHFTEARNLGFLIQRAMNALTYYKGKQLEVAVVITDHEVSLRVLMEVDPSVPPPAPNQQV